MSRHLLGVAILIATCACVVLAVHAADRRTAFIEVGLTVALCAATVLIVAGSKAVAA